MEFEIVRGDIANQSADALVNAAGTSLRMGSGVAGALLRQADGPIERDARVQGPVDLGEVVVTDAYDLEAEYVIHAAVVPHGGVRERATAESVRRATDNSLSRADGLGCRSLVLPALGCGNGGVYIREGGELICRTVREFEPASLEAVRIVAYTDRERTALERTAAEIRRAE